MDNVLFKVSYGLYLLSTILEEKQNGCIIDACIQAAEVVSSIIFSDNEPVTYVYYKENIKNNIGS